MDMDDRDPSLLQHGRSRIEAPGTQETELFKFNKALEARRFDRSTTTQRLA